MNDDRISNDLKKIVIGVGSSVQRYGAPLVVACRGAKMVRSQKYQFPTRIFILRGLPTLVVAGISLKRHEVQCLSLSVCPRCVTRPNRNLSGGRLSSLTTTRLSNVLFLVSSSSIYTYFFVFHFVLICSSAMYSLTQPCTNVLAQ